MAVMMSIGLLVDFIMHILLRYYESDEKTREEKVRDALETMGYSLLLGGLSTFLGIMPLAFSTSKLLNTVFTAFVGMVALGVSHGLIFLPVVLSLVGTTDCIRLEHKELLPPTKLHTLNQRSLRAKNDPKARKLSRRDSNISSSTKLSSYADGSSRSEVLEITMTSDSTPFSLPR